MTRDARLPALHRGDFGLRSRASLTGSSPKLALRRAPDRSQRAPRVRVVVPGGRGPVPPGAAVTSRRRGTPRLASPRSAAGGVRTTPFVSKAGIFLLHIANRSQELNSPCTKKFFGLAQLRRPVPPRPLP